MITRKIDILLKVIFSLCLLIYLSSWGLISINPLLLRINSCIGIASGIYLIFFEKKINKKIIFCIIILHNFKLLFISVL